MSDPLGEQLLAAGLLDRDRLATAELAQQIGDIRRGIEPGDNLARIVIQLGFVDARDVARVECEVLGKVSYFLVDGFPVTPDVAAQAQDPSLGDALLPLYKHGSTLVLLASESPSIETRQAVQITFDVRDLQLLPIAADRLQELSKNIQRTAGLRRVASVRLGEILLRDGHIGPQQLEQALHSARTIWFWLLICLIAVMKGALKWKPSDRTASETAPRRTTTPVCPAPTTVTDAAKMMTAKTAVIASMKTLIVFFPALGFGVDLVIGKFLLFIVC